MYVKILGIQGISLQTGNLPRWSLSTTWDLVTGDFAWKSPAERPLQGPEQKPSRPPL